jgi:hypothetical protein
MTTSLWALQAAIYTALNDDSTLGALISGVYDYVPQETEKDYVVIGEQSGTDWDTKTFQGWEDEISIHTFTEGRGKKDCKAIMDEIYRILHGQALTVAGFNLLFIRQEFVTLLQEEDGLTFHGVQRFKAITHN